jgi:hypothetical protein
VGRSFAAGGGGDVGNRVRSCFYSHLIILRIPPCYC